MDRIQRGYYGYEFVRDVVAARAEAIRRTLPARSRLIDLGCNDATISNVLIEAGYASSSLAIDFEDVRRKVRPEVTFVAADLRQLDVASLPRVDVVLCLNVVHHLALHGVDFARNFLATLSTKAGTVLCDLGSLTATTELGAPWARLMHETWSSDEQCWADLFRPFAWRRPLLTYPFQGGRRVLWKLTTPLEPRYDYDIVGEDPSARVLQRRGTEERFWTKVASATSGAEPSLARSLLLELLRTCPFDCVLPLEWHAVHGEVFPYDQELEGAPPAASGDVIAGVEAFGAQDVPFAGGVVMRDICDFEARATSRGVTFFGFALRPGRLASLIPSR